MISGWKKYNNTIYGRRLMELNYLATLTKTNIVPICSLLNPLLDASSGYTIAPQKEHSWWINLAITIVIMYNFCLAVRDFPLEPLGLAWSRVTMLPTNKEERSNCFILNTKTIYYSSLRYIRLN